MPDEETSRLPPGYRLDLVGDPCIIILRGPDGAVVARFSRSVDPKEIRRAAEEARAKKETKKPLIYSKTEAARERFRAASSGQCLS